VLIMKVLVVVLVLAAGGHPASGVRVSIDGHARYTGRAGQATFRERPGRHVLASCGRAVEQVTVARRHRTALTVRCIPAGGLACAAPGASGPLPPLGEARREAERIATEPITSEVVKAIANGGAEVTYEGTFVDYLAPVPPGSAAPKGTKLTLTMDSQGRVYMEHLYDGRQATC
jgi:hypothetical protein